MKSTVLCHTARAKEDSSKIEMSSYIALDSYADHEADHAGWRESTGRIIQTLKEHERKLGRQLFVMEHGPGPGTSSIVFAQGLPEMRLTAVELDKNCCTMLVEKLHSLNIGSVSVANVSSLEFDPDRRQDSVVSMFSMSHLNPSNQIQFLHIAREKILAKDGLFIFADEFLSDHDAGDKDSLLHALWEHHGAVIFHALHHRRDHLAHLELDALISGARKIGDFKISTAEMETRLTDAGFEILQKIKIYPNLGDVVPLGADVDAAFGVYLYIATPCHANAL